MTPKSVEHAVIRRALIVTALPVEYAAVRRHLTDLAEDEHPQGDIYERGSFQAGGQFWQVGIVEMGMGNPNAAQKSERAIAHFQPEAVLFVGVAGGIKDAGIGDVVVATKVYGYHFGKAAGDFKTRPEVGLPGHRLLERARAESRKQDWLQRLPKPPETATKVFLGAIAAGEQVVTSTQSVSYQLIRNSYNDALALEMESYGFFKAAQANSGLEALAVRGISDLLEGKAEADGGGSQERASQHAAAFAFEVLAKLKLPEKNVRVETREVVLEVRAAPAKPACSSLPPQPFFFGREKELASVAQAISPEARTWGALIDGPGGIGKTALAVRAGHLAPSENFERKIFLSAKVRDLKPSGEQQLDDFALCDYLTLLAELARELGEESAAQANPDERAKAVKRALLGKRILLVIDNVETFAKAERDRLYQFLSLLPDGCKAIVTSRRRNDIDARIIRLDRLDKEAALELLAALAEDNPQLRKATEQERIDLYEITGGNPLLIRWTAGQLGRAGSRCRTVADACAFLHAAPKGNDPLEYIFGDLVDTFTPSETAVLAALALFSHPASVGQIAAVAGLAEQAACTALDDLNDRALLVSDEEGEKFLLPKLAATFIRRQRPEAVAESGDRLTERAFALALENGYQQYKRFPVLEAEWPLVAAALPFFVAGENERLQRVCYALDTFLEFSVRLDDWLSLSQQAEEKAETVKDSYSAGWRAHQTGWIYSLRGQAAEVLVCATRCAEYWVNSGARNRAGAIQLRGLGYKLDRNYPAAIAAYQESLDLYRTIAPQSEDVGRILSDLAEVKRLKGDFAAAELDYNESLRIAKEFSLRDGVAAVIGRLAELALDRKDLPQAEELARQALSLAEKIGRQVLIAVNCRRIATALARQGKAAEGLDYARRAVDIFTRLRQPDELEKAQAALRECGGA